MRLGPFTLRWPRALLGVLVVFVLGAAGVFSLATERFECRRHVELGPTCIVSRSAPLPHEDRFPPGSISSVEVFKRNYGKANAPPTYVVALLDRLGKETIVYRFKTAEQATLARDRVASFLADPSQPGFVEERPPSRFVYLFLVGALLVGVAVVLGPPGGGTARAPVALSPLHRRPWPRVLLFVVGIVIVGNLVGFLVNTTTKTWLEIRAESRCTFQGAELLPGGMVRMGMEPGSYPIEVWSPDPSGHWQSQSIAVTANQTTLFVCRSRSPAAR